MCSSDLDSGTVMKSIVFNENTRFPAGRDKMPASESGDDIYKYQPEYIMRQGKNPGLGVKSLHERGITGKGVSVAVIDEPLITDHPEYKGKIVEYRDFGSEAVSSMQGPAVASLLAGENTGTAPGVKIYYAAVPAWDMYDAEYYAKALDWIIGINASLPDGEKIRAACISPNPENPSPWINVNKYLASFKRAQEAGILVLDCTSEHGLVAGACKYNFDEPEDVSLCKPVSLYRIFISGYHYSNVKDILNDESEQLKEITIRVPAAYRTIAEAYGGEPEHSEYSYQYQYDGRGRLSWTLPYLTGVLAMGWQVNPELTPDMITKILFDTAHVDHDGHKYINPVRFIEFIGDNGENKK